MPVFSAVITSKRARRGRSSECSSHPLQGSSDLRRLKRKLDEVTNHKDSAKQEAQHPFSASTGNIHSGPTSSATMSTWQATENGNCTHGVTLSQNNDVNGTNSSPKSPINKSDLPSGVEKSFQRRRSFSSRKRDVDEILAKHPHKVPIIIERARKEKNLSLLDKSKFLVPEELTMSQLTTIIRRRLQLSDTQAFYLIINRRTMASASMTLAEVYRNDKDDDGFLYIVYASQEMFG